MDTIPITLPDRNPDPVPSVPAPVTVVAIAASAGGLNALTQILGHLGPEFPAPVVVVQHMDRRHPSLLPEILTRVAKLKVKQAEEGETILPGTVYLPQPNFHLLVVPGGKIALAQSDPVHFVRPSADVLFRSIAQEFGSRAVAVVVSGTGVDGAEGVRAIRQAGGTVLVQDSSTSEFSGMPDAAIATGAVDQILPLEAIAARLVSLTATGAP